MDIALALNESETGHLSVALAVCAQLPAEGTVPEWIELLPSGRQVKGQDGREWLNDRPDAVIAEFNRLGRPLPLDLEHSTEKQAPQGLPAPAVGWIEELKARDGGSVWGRVAWTPKGYYAASPGAEGLIGWHVNRDP